MTERKQSLHTLDTLYKRIETTSKDSPLLVKRTDKKGVFDVKFASTIESAKKIARGGKDLLGVFHKENKIQLMIATSD